MNPRCASSVEITPKPHNKRTHTKKTSDRPWQTSRTNCVVCVFGCVGRLVACCVRVCVCLAVPFAIVFDASMFLCYGYWCLLVLLSKLFLGLFWRWFYLDFFLIINHLPVPRAANNPYLGPTSDLAFNRWRSFKTRLHTNENVGPKDPSPEKT